MKQNLKWRSVLPKPPYKRKKTFVEEMTEILDLLGIAGITSMTRRQKKSLAGRDDVDEMEDLIMKTFKIDSSADQLLENNPDLDPRSIESAMIVYFKRLKKVRNVYFLDFLNYFCPTSDSIGVK